MPRPQVKHVVIVVVSVLFSEPKIPQCVTPPDQRLSYFCFSALQRAENSSIRWTPGVYGGYFVFQCSSASRKFLNPTTTLQSTAPKRGFSALQRAENSSMLTGALGVAYSLLVSVLFSEPKIPQWWWIRAILDIVSSFSALQRAENSSIVRVYATLYACTRFQCSSASRKFLNITPKCQEISQKSRFSALQRAENSSIQARMIVRGL